MSGMDAKLFARWARALSSGITLLALLLSFSTAGQAQNSLAAALQAQSEFLPVREAYRLDGALTPDGNLRLYWQITEGYYLYQHAFKVRPHSTTPAEPLAITFPPAIAKTDAKFSLLNALISPEFNFKCHPIPYETVLEKILTGFD